MMVVDGKIEDQLPQTRQADVSPMTRLFAWHRPDGFLICDNLSESPEYLSLESPKGRRSALSFESQYPERFGHDLKQSRGLPDKITVQVNR